MVNMIKSSLEFYADIAQYAIPVTAGVIQLVEGQYPAALAFSAAGVVHKLAVPHVKNFFPDAIRPNGKPGSFPSSHTSAVCMGAVFSLVREGPTVRSIALVGLAALTAFSRFWTDHHWPVDLLGGAVMGSLLALGANALIPNNTQ